MQTQFSMMRLGIIRKNHGSFQNISSVLEFGCKDVHMLTCCICTSIAQERVCTHSILWLDSQSQAEILR